MFANTIIVHISIDITYTINDTFYILQNKYDNYLKTYQL